MHVHSVFPILIIVLILYIMLRNIDTNKIKEESPLKVINYSYMPGVMYVDVREQGEYFMGHIPRSVNLPLSKLKAMPRKLPNDKTIIVICKNGIRSKKVVSFLKDQGYDSLICLKGGIEAWKKLGYPMDCGE